MSELKPCPLCGAQLAEVHYGSYGDPDGLWLMHFADEQAKCPMAALTFRATPAAITAYLASMREQGWVMVPREATDNMVDAARHFLEPQTERIGRSCYRAMIEAAKGE